jgi:hypothetical protein
MAFLMQNMSIAIGAARIDWIMSMR